MNWLVVRVFLLVSGFVVPGMSIPTMALAAEQFSAETPAPKTGQVKKRNRKKKIRNRANPAFGSASEEDSSEATGRESSSGAYVYLDALGGAPAPYQVFSAKVTKPRADIVGSIMSRKLESLGGSVDSTRSWSGSFVGGGVTVPVTKTLNIGGGVVLTKMSEKVSLKSGLSSLEFTSSLSNTDFPVSIASHVTDLIDAGLALRYSIYASKSGTKTTEYKYLTYTPSIGVHRKNFEASFSYQPGLKTKAEIKDSSDNSADASGGEVEISSEMAITGRYLLTPAFFFGGGYGLESEKNLNDSQIKLEAGWKSSALQIAGGLSLESAMRTVETSDVAQTKSENAFSIEATYLNRHRQPFVSAVVEYRKIDIKYDGDDETGASIGAIFGAHLHF